MTTIETSKPNPKTRTTMSNEIEQMVEAVEAGGDRVLGTDDAADVAQEWIDAGLTAAQAAAYIEAGCWDGSRVGELVAAGVTAEEIADDDVIDEVIRARDWASRQRGGNGYDRDNMCDSLPYMHSNRDYSTAEILAAAIGVRKARR